MVRRRLVVFGAGTHCFPCLATFLAAVDTRAPSATLTTRRMRWADCTTATTTAVVAGTVGIARATPMFPATIRTSDTAPHPAALLVTVRRAWVRLALATLLPC